MLFLYTLFLYISTPVLLLRLWWKGRLLPAYRQRISERFCWDHIEEQRFDVWLHAVSLGEVIAAIPLIDALLQKNHRLLVTTMTPTGSERVQQRFGNRVCHRYLPYDLPSVIQRFFKKLKPRVGLIIETELWPNLIAKAYQSKIPLLLINARLSEQSYQGYRKVKFFFKPLLAKFNGILAQSEADAQRFQALGASKTQVSVLGNIKFDLQMTVKTSDAPRLKQSWGEERTVIILASTHEKEEQEVLSCFNWLREKIPGALLLIAPRHPERFQRVYTLSQEQGFKTELRSQAKNLSAETEVLIVDSLGELLCFYQLSDYAFVGGSFVPVGGHNVLEPIAMGVPVFTGKNVHNFKAICEELEKAQALGFVDTGSDLIEKIIDLHNHPEKKHLRIDKATQVLKKNQGALGRYMDQVEALLQA